MSADFTENEQWKLLVLSLKQAADRKGIRQEDIATESGLTQSNISRFFGLKYKPTLPTFLAIAEAVRVNIITQDQDSIESPESADPENHI